MSVEDFLSIWNGVIIAIDHNQGKLKNHFSFNIFFAIGLTSIFSIYILKIFNVSWHVGNSTHLFLSLIGLVINILIYIRINRNSSILNKLCTFSKKFNCDEVFNSQSAKIYKNITINDFALVFFISNIILLPYEDSRNFIYLFSILSTPITIITLYYQWRIIKKWCPICIGITIIIWIMSINIISFVNIKEILVFNFNNFINFLFIITISSLWLLIKEYCLVKKEIYNYKLSALTFRRNQNLFLPFFYSQNKLNIEPQSYDIVFGSDIATNEILVITNPICHNCNNVYWAYKKTLSQRKNNIRIRMRFYIPLINKHNTQTYIALQLISLNKTLSEEKFLSVLDYFYSNTIKEWIKVYGVIDLNSIDTKILVQQKEWCEQNYILTTPAIIINGRKFPDIYHPTDFVNFLDKVCVEN